MVVLMIFNIDIIMLYRIIYMYKGHIIHTITTEAA